MDLHRAHRFIVLVFSVYLTVRVFKVSAIEMNSERYVPCEQDWYFFGDKCYKMFGLNNKRTWTNSVDSCTSVGGHLASIHSKELQEFLTVQLLFSSKSSAWIGLRGRVSETKFSWIDGSAYNYSSWDDDEPSRQYADIVEECVEMRYKGVVKEIGMWNDEPCDRLKPYICQKNTNADIHSPDLRFCTIEDGEGFKYLNSCYHVVEKEKSWEEAEKYCNENYKGHLISVLDNNADIFLNYLMRVSNICKNVWIGIKMKNNTMQKWTSGWHVPNKIFEGLDVMDGRCVVKTNWDSWVIVPCQNENWFICERLKYDVPVLQKPPSDDWVCPYSGKNWIDLGGDSCYYIETTHSRNWHDANYECGRKGGTLASFLSENETQILHPHVLETQEKLFIGLRRNYAKKDIFEWADGNEVVYQNWHEGKPNNIKQECGELYTESMTWNDVSCEKTRGYICKTRKKCTGSKDKEVKDRKSSSLKDDQTYSNGTFYVEISCTACRNHCTTRK